tara:strand:- start:223 stop:876 length:654 start_codon:yes stop_codon:yes gene_type:complete
MIRKDNWIYLHIPRTAGSYIENLFHKHYDLLYEVDHHSTVYDIKDKKDMFIFGFVRNPYSYEWSLWKYCQSSWEIPFTFDEWCAYRFDGKSDEGYAKYPRPSNEANYDLYVREQAGYFCDENKKCAASKIYRFEQLKESWDDIQKRINTDIKMNIIDLKHKNDYKTVYSDYSYDLVSKYKAKDIELFGYNFDGFTGDIPLDYSVDYVGTRYAYTRSI